MKKKKEKSQRLSLEEISFLGEGLSFSARTLKTATDGITERYKLGPRGAWILFLIKNRLVRYPLDVSNFFQIGRSLITLEIARLMDSELISYRQGINDRRRVELDVTARGRRVALRAQDELTNLVVERFAGYSRKEVLLCARMLNDFITIHPPRIEEAVEPPRRRSNQPRARA